MSRRLLILSALFSLCGCAGLASRSADTACDDCLPPRVAGQFYNHTCDNLLTSLTAQKCARRDLKQLKQSCESLTTDFRRGYTQAYIDLAAGRPACLPAVPPQKYWYAWHRSCAGSGAVVEWYDGYRAGLDYGVNSGVSRFNRIVVPPSGCCVSASYVNPYTSSHPAGGVLPANRQTISQPGMTSYSAENSPDTNPPVVAGLPTEPQHPTAGLLPAVR